jgi:hypothetical protein
MRRDEILLRLRHWSRLAVRRLWPTMPTTWPEGRRRLGHVAAQVGRLTVAAVVAYLASTLISPDALDLTAPLTALLVVQASTVQTLRMGLVRVGAVLVGVLVAIGFSAYFGLSWWSLGAVIAASLLLARVLRLGEQSLETPISAMLILGVTTHGLAAETRLVNTLIGTAVGIAMSLLVPVAIPNTRARDTVRDVARSQAALLDEIAISLAVGPAKPEEAESWLRSADTLDRPVSDARRAVDAVEESRKLNPRALVALRIHPELRVALDRLERCRAAEHALLAMIRRAAERRAASEDDLASDLRGAFSVVLDSLASSVGAFGDLVAADRVEQAQQSLDRLVDLIGETRALLTNLALVNVEARPDTDTWMLQGSMFAAVDQILMQLDLEHPEQAAAAWSTRRGLDRMPRTWVETGQRLSEPVRRQISGVRRDRGER